MSEEETEVHAGAATWQKLHILISGSQFSEFLVEHTTELQVLLLGTQITFSCSSHFCFWAKAMKSEAMPIKPFLHSALSQIAGVGIYLRVWTSICKLLGQLMGHTLLPLVPTSPHQLYFLGFGFQLIDFRKI